MKEYFIVRYKDIPVVKFSYEDTILGLSRNRVFEVVDVTTKKELIPVHLLGNIEGWIKSRVVPKNRAFVGQILASVGVSDIPIDVIRISLGLSLIDNYWVVPEGFTGTFSEYNLFENDFSETLALVAFTGHTSKITGLKSSPELSGDGMFPKCWRKIGSDNVLFKGGTEGFANAGMEPYSEYYISKIEERMGIQYVPYNLEKFKGILCSTCPAFTTVDISFVPYYLRYGLDALDTVVNNFKSLGLLEYFSQMMILDAITYNTDRHLGNFGFIYNLDTGMLNMAPIFDNGLGLLPYAFREDLYSVENLEKYAKDRQSALGFTHLYIAEQLMTSDLKSQLRRLINFRFDRHSQYNMPESRLNLLEEFIQRRVHELIGTKSIPVSKMSNF